MAGVEPRLVDPESVEGVDAEPSRRLEVGIAVVAVAGSIAVLVLSGGIESQVDAGGVSPQWWPRTLAVVALVISVALLVVAVSRAPFARDDLNRTTAAGWRRVLVTAAASVLFIVAWDTVGFVVGCPLYLAALMALYGKRGLMALVVFPVVTTAGLYAMFHLLLRVPL